MLKYIMLFALFATTADATCRIQTTLGSCQTPPRSPKPPAAGLGPAPIEIGTILERGEYSIVLNSQWYGLPRPKDGWVYFRIQDDVYRVDYETREVLERATREANQNWP